MMDWDSLKYDVFVSHASANKAWVSILARNLRDQELEVFYDEWSLVPGDQLVDALYQGLQQSRAGLLVVSPEAANSGWVSKEYQRMVNRQANESCFTLIPVVYDEVAEFPFSEDILWADFRPPQDYRRTFYKLLCALRKTQTEPDAIFTGDLSIPGSETETPLESDAEDFFAQIFAALNSNPIQLLLAPHGRAGGPVIKTLLNDAKSYFGQDNVWHLAPPFDADVDDDTYFSFLAKQSGLDAEINNAIDFQIALQARLMEVEPLFILISQLENGSASGRHKLAGMIRNFSETHFGQLQTLILGGERLLELKYAQGDLSMLNTADDHRWPELTLTDVLNMAAASNIELDDDLAQQLLQLTGGHSQLLHHCLRVHRQQKGQIDFDFRNALINSPAMYQLFVPFRQDSDQQEQVKDLLAKDDLGAAEPYLSDPLLRKLQWLNMLCEASGRLHWRCPGLREAGQQILVS